MTRTCLNPDCDREVAVVGVCLPCANSDYKPRKDGADAGHSLPAADSLLSTSTTRPKSRRKGRPDARIYTSTSSDSREMD